MAKTAKPKKKNKKMKILKVAFAAFFVYVVVSFTMMQVDIAARRDTLAQAQAEYNEEVYLNTELTDLINSGENTDYIMRIAREKLGFAFPNERVIVDIHRKS